MCGSVGLFWFYILGIDLPLRKPYQRIAGVNFFWIYVGIVFVGCSLQIHQLCIGMAHLMITSLTNSLNGM